MKDEKKNMENKNKLISIIVPVYNIISELPQCINSILSQIYQEFELLIIDDGSTDGSSAFCDELAIADDRIRVIHQENSGVSVARNKGISEAKGDLIAFIDGDDWIAPNYLQRLMEEMKDDIAISMCGHVRLSFYDQPFPSQKGDAYIFFAKDCAHRLLCGRFPISSWGCLLRRNLIDDIRFPPGVCNNEDKMFLFRYLLKNQDWKVSFTNDQLYGYYVREGSASKIQRKGSMDIVWVADEIEKLVLTKHPEWKEEAKNSTITARFTMLKSIMRANEVGENLQTIRREIIERGWPRMSGHRTKIEYFCLIIGIWCYQLLVKMYYGMIDDGKRYKTNEKMIHQGQKKDDSIGKKDKKKNKS